MLKFRDFFGADWEVRATAGWEAGATLVRNGPSRSYWSFCRRQSDVNIA